VGIFDHFKENVVNGKVFGCFKIFVKIGDDLEDFELNFSPRKQTNENFLSEKSIKNFQIQFYSKN
jgi:hypothetical protein